MPSVTCRTNRVLDQERAMEALRRLSAAVAAGTGKSEQVVMADLAPAAMLMAGSDAPAAFVDVRGIGGFDPAMNRRLSGAICEALQAVLAIAPDRIYINFTPYKATDWGWDGGTFG